MVFFLRCQWVLVEVKLNQFQKLKKNSEADLYIQIRLAV